MANKQSLLKAHRKIISKKNRNLDSTSVRMATSEQLETIEMFRKNFNSHLHSTVEQANMISALSSSTGVYQPILSEHLLQQVNFNPRAATSEMIDRWLLNPNQNDINLRGLSQYLENTVGQYQRAIHYFTDMLSFNYDILPKDVDNEKIINENKQEYLKSYHNACSFVQKMNVKNTFRSMALTIMQDGVSFWLKVDGYKGISFLPIPTDYCRITAKWERGWKGEVNLAYFDRMYGLADCLPEISEAYSLFLSKRQEGLQGEYLAPYQYFPLPLESTWIFNFDMNKAVKVPPLSSTMGASLDVLSFRNLLKDQTITDINKVFALKIPQKKSGDSLMFSYDEAADMVSAIQSILPENMNVFASPFEVNPVNTNQISSLDKTIDLSNNSFYSSAGVSPTFFGLDSKSAKALDISQMKDFLFSSSPIYSQFNNMVNWFLDLEMEKYNWKVNFFGNKLKENEEINTALKMVTTANFPVSRLAATAGYEPAELLGIVNIEDALGIKEKMKPLVSAFQQSGGAEKGNKEVGKPKEDMGTISTEGLDTRDSRGEV